MNRKKAYSSEGNLLKSSLLLLPILLIMYVFVLQGTIIHPGNVPATIASVITFVFFSSMFFMMLYSGRTDKYRAICFATIAIFFAISFINNLIATRGSMTFSNEELLSNDIPFCHIVTTMIIIPAAIKQTIIFPGSMTEGYASIASMLVFIIVFSIVLGRSFCSWGCFYGGWDDGFSHLRKRPVVKKINARWRWLAFGVFAIVAVISAFILSPFYCDWLCPFKLITEYEEITSFTTLLKTIVFVSLFLGLVIILPILTKKRIQCATFCPMGALMSLMNKINIFNVKIDKAKCIECGVCEKQCPMLAIDHKAIERGSVNMSCSKCGACIDACPKEAIHFHVKGTPPDKHLTLTRMLFLYSAYSLMIIFLGGNMIDGIQVVINLFF